MSAVDVKTKDAEHSFVTWWGSMCCGAAWGQEVHQTSHAALHHKIAVKACNALHYWQGNFCFHKGQCQSTHTGMSLQTKTNTPDFLISMTRHHLLTYDERITEKKKKMLLTWIVGGKCVSYVVCHGELIRKTIISSRWYFNTLMQKKRQSLCTFPLEWSTHSHSTEACRW